MTGDFAHVKADSRRTYFASYGPSPAKDKGQLPWLLKKPWKAPGSLKGVVPFHAVS